MVLTADKGRATFIMNTTDYKTKCLDLLSDSETYKKKQERSYKCLSHITHQHVERSEGLWSTVTSILL